MLRFFGNDNINIRQVPHEGAYTKIMGTILGVPIIRTRVWGSNFKLFGVSFLGLYTG